MFRLPVWKDPLHLTCLLPDKNLPGIRILNLPLCPKPPSIIPSSPVDSLTFRPTKIWMFVSFLNNERPITL